MAKMFRMISGSLVRRCSGVAAGLRCVAVRCDMSESNDTRSGVQNNGNACHSIIRLSTFRKLLFKHMYHASGQSDCILEIGLLKEI